MRSVSIKKGQVTSPWPGMRSPGAEGALALALAQPWEALTLGRQQLSSPGEPGPRASKHVDSSPGAPVSAAALGPSHHGPDAPRCSVHREFKPVSPGRAHRTAGPPSVPAWAPEARDGEAWCLHGELFQMLDGPCVSPTPPLVTASAGIFWG